MKAAVALSGAGGPSRQPEALPGPRRGRSPSPRPARGGRVGRARWPSRDVHPSGVRAYSKGRPAGRLRALQADKLVLRRGYGAPPIPCTGRREKTPSAAGGWRPGIVTLGLRSSRRSTLCPADAADVPISSAFQVGGIEVTVHPSPDTAEDRLRDIQSITDAALSR